MREEDNGTNGISSDERHYFKRHAVEVLWTQRDLITGRNTHVRDNSGIVTIGGSPDMTLDVLHHTSICAMQVDDFLLKDFVDKQKAHTSANTINSRFNVISQVFAFAVRRGYIDHDRSKTVEQTFSTELEEEGDAFLGWPCPTPEEIRLILTNSP